MENEQKSDRERDNLKIAEDFYSMQGEGVTRGVPSHFIRLQGCNLFCGLPNMKYVNDPSNQDEIDAAKSDKADWVCDTIAVWQYGTNRNNQYLFDRFEQNGELENILSGIEHLIWTGGEPMMPKNRESIEGFLDEAYKRYPNAQIYNEVETNGTSVVPDGFYQKYIDQINTSPKLSNNGMPEKARINGDAIEQIRDHPNSWFKFVVANYQDVEEAQDTYIDRFNIPKEKVMLMPAVNNIYDLPEMTKFAYETALDKGYKATSRDHVLAWDRVTGV